MFNGKVPYGEKNAWIKILAERGSGTVELIKTLNFFLECSKMNCVISDLMLIWQFRRYKCTPQHFLNRNFQLTSQLFSLDHFMHLRLIQVVMQPSVNVHGCLLPKMRLHQHIEVWESHNSHVWEKDTWMEQPWISNNHGNMGCNKQNQQKISSSQKWILIFAYGETGFLSVLLK